MQDATHGQQTAGLLFGYPAASQSSVILSSSTASPETAREAAKLHADITLRSQVIN